MHCADEVEKPLPHFFEAAVLMGFALWGKLEFNQRDGFWIARMVTGSAAAGWLVKSIFFSWLDIFRELQRARSHREHPEFV